jgi:hypothetical protein
MKVSLNDWSVKLVVLYVVAFKVALFEELLDISSIIINRIYVQYCYSFGG